MAIGPEQSAADARDPGGLRVDAGVTLYCELAWGEIKGVPKTFEWLPRFWQLLQASLLIIAPGVLAAWLAAGGYPTSLRTCIRTIVAFFLGSAAGHWISFPLMVWAAKGRPSGMSMPTA
jgi:hypothetical protein